MKNNTIYLFGILLFTGLMMLTSCDKDDSFDYTIGDNEVQLEFEAKTYNCYQYYQDNGHGYQKLFKESGTISISEDFSKVTIDIEGHPFSSRNIEGISDKDLLVSYGRMTLWRGSKATVIIYHNNYETFQYYIK